MASNAGGAREVLWRGYGRNVPLLVTTAVVGVLVLFILGLLGLHPIAAALLAGALAAVGVTFSQVIVVVDHRWITTSFGPWGWPQRRFRLEELDRVGPTRVEQERKSDGTVRSGLFWPRRSGMVVRPGEALVLESARHPFIVSVDGAADAAAVIDHLLGRES
jgi:hypothetical protein